MASGAPAEQRKTLQRLFFALWPSDRVRRGIQAVANTLPAPAGRLVALDNLHITLLFLGSINAERRACALRAADSVSGRVFTLLLDHIGWWRGPRVVWFGASTVPEALTELAGSLHIKVSPCGIALDRRPLHAHVTLARKAARAVRVADPPPVQWEVTSFALVESVTRSEGAHYAVLKTWPLS